VTGTAYRPIDDAGRNSAGTRIARLGSIVWPSFFAAGVATTAFFAIVDPSDLAEIAWPHMQVSREFGYSVGFFMFWACTFGSSLFTAWLLQSPSSRMQSEAPLP
jgi:hypothetical protein